MGIEQIFVILFVLTLIAIVLVTHYNLRKRSYTCSKEANKASQELNELFIPTKLFTDEELISYQQKYKELVERIKVLYSSIFVDDEFLDKIGLSSFLNKYNEAPQIKEKK